jgi:hypothetical protein
MSTPPTGASLDGARAKLDWAKVHIESFKLRERQFGQGKPYQVEAQHHPELGDETVQNISAVITAVDPVPVELQLELGDALQNMRSALDHLAWQLVVANGGTPGDATQFPIYDSRLTQKGKVRTVDIAGGVNQKALAIIKRLQPYRRPNPAEHPLSVLQKLNNVDKHRLLVVLGMAYDSIEIAFGDHRPHLTNTTEPIPLKPGAQISGIGFDPSLDPKPYMKVYAKLTPVIAFGQSEPSAGLPVREVLADLHKFVEHVVVLLGKFVI